MKNIDLRLGDCLEILPTLADKSVDAIITDLPYGTTACKWDVIIPFAPMWEQVKRVLTELGTFTTTSSQPFTSLLVAGNLEMFKYCWVWKKNRPTGMTHCANMPMKDYEDVCVFSKGSIGHINLVKNRMTYYPQGTNGCNKINSHKSWGMEGTQERESQSKRYLVTQENYPRMVIDFNKDDRKRLHPTQKPVALYEYLIKTYTNEGDTVLDFVMGSGTTGVACVKLNRNFIGIEREPKYFDIASRRIAEAQQQTVMTT